MQNSANPPLYALIVMLLWTLPTSTAWGAAGHGSLAGLETTTGVKLHYSRNARTGTIRMLRTEPGRALPRRSFSSGRAVRSGDAAAPESAALDFMAGYGSDFGIRDPERELKVKRAKAVDRGRSFVRFQQLHQGLPVIGGELVVQLDAANDLVSVHGRTSPSAAQDTVPVVSAAEAGEAALRTIAGVYGSAAVGLTASEPELSIYDPSLLDYREQPVRQLVWRLDVTASGSLPVRELVLVDAVSGLVALHFNQIDHAKYRTVYDSNNVKTVALPGTVPVRIEGGGPSGITDADLAYEYLGDTYDFFNANFGRDSIDGAGMGLIGTVRYCPNDATSPCPYSNAFWDGSQMVFGQGFASADDVVAHELTHGVTERTAGLFYYMQSGAINESLSDIFGEFIDLTNGKGTDTLSVSWKLGEDLPGGAFRDMKNPPSMSTVYGRYPDRMTSGDYFCGMNDNGGVHINSSISNKAAYLMTEGGTFNGRNITGLGIPKAAQIFYEAQAHLLVSASDFADLHDGLILACGNLIGTAGITAADCREVQKAVDAVEMDRQPTFCAAPEAPLCPAGTTPVNVFFDNFENGIGSWTSTALTGTNAWAGGLGVGYATSGTHALYGEDLATTSDSSIQSVGIGLPPNAYLHFRHFYEFEYNMSSLASIDYFDGSVVEYSANGGAWQDAGPLFTNNGYMHVVSSLDTNPLKGRSAFAGISNGFISSRLNLAPVGGQNVRFRFRIGSDSSAGALGWEIDDFRIYTCSDTVLPAVSAVMPVNGSVGIPLNSKVTAQFSEAMNAGTVTGANFSLANSSTGAPVAGTVSYNPTTLAATFTPTASLAGNTPLTATINTGVRDLAGNAPPAAISWHFRTAASTDTAAPTVIARSPVTNATGVPLTTSVVACFGEEMDAATISASTFIVNSGGITGTVGYNAATRCAIFRPSVRLVPSTLYTTTITTGVRDAAGNSLAANAVWNFTTTANGAPSEVVFNGGFEIDGTKVLGWSGSSTIAGSYLFSKSAGAGHNGSSFFGYLGKVDNATEYIRQAITIPDTATAATARFWYYITTAETEAVAYDYLYAIITDNDGLVLDLIGTKSNMDKSTGWLQSAAFDLLKYRGRTVFLQFFAANDETLPTTFRVDDVSVVVSSPPADTTAPAVVATGPPAGAAGVAINATIGATFSEAMDAATFTNGTFTLNNGVTGTVSYDAATMTALLAPSVGLAPNSSYTATISSAAKDLAGNPLPLKTWNFATTAVSQSLSVNLAGSGTGSVHSSPAGIACGSGACSAPFYYDTVATLTAAPSAGSVFAGWTGACTGAGGECLVTMSADKSVTGSFSYVPARIYGVSPVYYGTLQSACNAAADNDLIQVQAAVLGESPVLGRPVAITIKGGYGADFNAVTGITTLGPMTIQHGTVTVDNLAVQ